MRNESPKPAREQPPLGSVAKSSPLPLPTTVFRRRAWSDFQRALDPLAPPKPLPPART